MAEMVAEPASVAEPSEPAPVTAPEALVEAPQRFTLEAVEAAPGPREDPAGRRIAVIGGDPAVADRLRELGALVSDTVPDRLDGLVFLGVDGESARPAGFPVIQSALRAGARQLVAVDEPGMRGLVRSIAVEYPDARVRLIDDAGHVVDELLTGGVEPVLVRTGDRRHAFALRRVDLDSDLDADLGAALGAALGLRPDSVVLLVGGARGITAEVATALAATSGCQVEVAGRTVPAEVPEDHATAAAADLPALRTALAGLGNTDRARIDTASIDKKAREILAQREIAATLRQLRRHSPDSGYRVLDVRDELAVTQLVKQVYAERGRLDGVVYAAGVVEDRLLADKTEDSFRRVYGTKVDGLSALLGGLSDLPAPPNFVVAFGSIAAAIGNRGQGDYAAANDAMDQLTARWAIRHGARALTVHWGPWAPGEEHGGMVSPELAREYARRGVSLIEPSHGVAALMRELAFGPPDARSVIYSAPGPWTRA
jgi:NAD(P)-dependent dehydrogenase (short-subunit alcohol dehydrogenase family)